MANITTKKDPVVLINDPQPSNMALNVGPGVVGLLVKNDSVEHACALLPDEAVRLGVNLIQLASQAHAMALHGKRPGLSVVPKP